MEVSRVQTRNDVVLQQRNKSNLYKNYIKYTIDTFVALLMLLVVSPLLLIISGIIKFDSKGPVIFKQTRIGEFGKEFQIYKFRTMYVDTPEQFRSPSDEKDPRITKVGRFLRKTSLDELPQLFNIIKGEMSFVGPRPEQKMIVDQYYTSYERQRFQVKPGLTGLWQISMDRTKPIHENLQYDLNYIDNQSFLLDMKVVFKTFLVMIKSNTV